jgi:hypothetical protein
VTKTEIVFKETTTVYHSTIFIGPDFCATTTVTIGSDGRPISPPAPTGSASKPSVHIDTSAGVSHGGTISGAPVVYPSGGQATVTNIAIPTGNGVWDGDVHTIGTNSEVWTWTSLTPSFTASTVVPTFSGSPHSPLPEPGSPSSNVTKPSCELAENKCNSPGDRSKWCDGQSIKTDPQTAEYKTGKICKYDFTLTNTTMDFDGSGSKITFAINGQVPGPLIECNWGDTLVVNVHNDLQDNATTIHWHGIIQKGSNDQDGVPGITECGIAPGSSRPYTMYLGQFGTGWYHSHALSQFGDGVHGPMIVHGPATANYDVDMGTIMIDDTFPVTAAQQGARIAHFGPTGYVSTTCIVSWLH